MKPRGAALHAAGAGACDAGYSLVELLVAAACSLLVISVLADLINANVATARRQPQATDIQQRLRVGAAALFADLYVAGAGLDAGAAAGPLVRYFPPVIPRRLGLRDDDGSDVARADAVSLIHVPATYAQSALLDPLSSTLVTLRADPGCPPGRVLCGLSPGAGLAVFDDAGRFDLFTVIGLQGSGGLVRRRATSAGYVFGAGAHAAEMEMSTYYLDASAHQLRRYDGDASDAAVIDDVTAFSLEYFGDPEPPRLPKPPVGDANCLYDAAGALVSGLASLPVADDGLAALPLGMLRDGPWCGFGATMFDADLLRVRRVRVTIAAGAASGGAGATVTFDVAPRNLEPSS